ncbi:MAG TPA: Rne/Rng family ribonuclease [Actinomycetota bacterium]
MNDEPQGAVTERAGADASGPASGASEPRSDVGRSAPNDSAPNDSATDASGDLPGASGSGTGTGTTGARRRRRGSRGRGRSGSGRSTTATADGDETSEGAVAATTTPEVKADDGDGARPSGARTGQARRSRPRQATGDRRSDGAADEAGDGDAASPRAATAANGESAPDPGSTADAASAPTASRRRHRGSRGRGRSRSGGSSAPPEAADADAEAASDAATAPRTAGTRARPAGTTREARTGSESADKGEQPSGDDAPLSSSAKRRRRRRRSGSGSANGAEATAAAARADGTPGAGESGAANGRQPKQAKRTAVKAEAASPTRTRSRSRTGSRSEAGEDGGPTRTRRSRATMRRREPMPVVPRGTDKQMLITEHGERDQIAVVEDRMLVEHYITRVGAKSMVGNIYLGRVQNVLPGMEAAFIDIGKGRNAVLYAGEVSYDEDIGGRQQRIEQVIKPGQAALVQVTKDPIGGKGPRLTQEISLPGRYVVMVPNSEVFGISRRLPDNERRRLRTIIKKVHPEEHGVIVRTAAEGATEQDLTDDLKRLAAEWEQISKRSKKVKAPALLYEEPELTVRVVRDLFNDEEFKEIVTDSEPVFATIREYLKSVAPELVDKVRMHDGRLPLFEQYHLVEQIHKALERKVWLPSGGYLVIDKTEAMTVIDVNTGKHVGKANLEDTVTKTNLEAAEEVARQLRLRDIGGMILIDFIDMLLEKNKREVVDTLKNAMAKDKTRSQVFDISPLGILEVTRKRVSGGLLDSFSETCPTCGGRGILITHEI